MTLKRTSAASRLNKLHLAVIHSSLSSKQSKYLAIVLLVVGWEPEHHKFMNLMSELDQPSVENLSIKNNDISTGNSCSMSVKETILNKYKGETLGGKYHGKGTHKFTIKKWFTVLCSDSILLNRSFIDQLRSIYIELHIQNYAWYNCACNLDFCVEYLLLLRLLLSVKNVISSILCL